MSDPLMDFLLSRDPVKVLAEAVPVPLERLWAEASIADRTLIEELPIGVLRRRLLDLEALLARKPKVQVIGSSELLQALRAANQRAKRDEETIRTLREVQTSQARIIAELRAA